MQIIVETHCSPAEYAAGNVDDIIEPVTLCPGCKKAKPHRHGYYYRFCIDGLAVRHIPVRRYYCRKCRVTISFLPSFCVPFFQHTLNVIWRCLMLHLGEGWSLADALNKLKELYPGGHWTLQQVHFYSQRFLNNLPVISVFLRRWLPQTVLPADTRKKARNVLAAIVRGFPNPKSFAKLYSYDCQAAFLTKQQR